MQAGRDLWWHELMAKASADCPAEPLDSETPLFILYTSGSTGKPKGISTPRPATTCSSRRRSSGSSTIATTTSSGARPTAAGSPATATSSTARSPPARRCVMYEGAPNFPDEDRFWEIIEKYKVTIFYTAPTAIRAFIKWGDHHVEKHDLSSLRLLGTVGEGINPEAWMWYHRKIGGERCPIVDTWWQTETGGIMMSPLPGAIATKPGSCTKPLPGIVPAIVDDSGKPVGRRTRAAARASTQALARHAPRHLGRRRALQGSSTGAKFPAQYLAGDNARRDDDGYYWIMGRIDDVLNVSGHRLSTIEVESALVSHPNVAEAAAVGRPDELKGEAVAVFVTLKQRRAERRAARRS